MKKIGLSLLVVILFSANLFAGSKSKANKDTKSWRYEIECVANGAEGTYLVKVSSYSKKQATALNQAVKNAVHGVLFKGVSGRAGECATQRPLANDPGIEYAKKDYFDRFFAKGGEYMKYGSTTGTPETTKIKREYKVSVIVSVHKDQLRKDLEAAGIIKGLSSGF